MATILIADDDDILRELLAAWMTLKGHVAAEARDGLEALGQLKAGTFDLIVCDVMMPRLDGLGLVEAIRADPARSGLPIVVLSMRSRGEDAANLIDAGADDYVRKPIDWPDLELRIDRALRRAAA